MVSVRHVLFEPCRGLPFFPIGIDKEVGPNVNAVPDGHESGGENGPVLVIVDGENNAN